ncbi:MAG TPA: hypothetical protein VJM12_05640 [Pyrinomonadaceae bacterium]|nr:hypothetical protein [Pyrinomonadaceae bacterium]
MKAISLVSQVLAQFVVTAVFGPGGRRGFHLRVFYIRICTLLDQKDDHCPVTVERRVVETRCMHNQIDAASLLLEKGAQIDAIPPGFDYSGTGIR